MKNLHRYDKAAKYIEVRTQTKKSPEVREVEKPKNRKQRRALESAQRSQRKLLVTRRT